MKTGGPKLDQVWKKVHSADPSIFVNMLLLVFFRTPWLYTLPTLTRPNNPEKQDGLMYFLGFLFFWFVFMLLLVNLEAVGSQFASFWESIKSTRNYDMFFYHFVILFMMVFDDAESVALYSADVDTPQNTIKSTRNYVVFC